MTQARFDDLRLAEILDGYPPASHKTDPWTSRAAEQEHTASGQREHNIERVLRAVQMARGATADDIAEATGLDVYETRRRLSDLKNSGRLVQGSAVVRTNARGNSRPVVTWYASEEGETA